MVSVVLLMAGCGTRMNLNVNKVLLPLGNKLVYEYPLDLFLECGCEVICVINEQDLPFLKDRLPIHVQYVLGGATRQESVKNGLELCSGEYVCIHDAARPFISKEIVQTILQTYKLNEAILCYRNVKDTIKIKEDGKLKTLPRESLMAASTPQCASLSILKEVYQKANDDSYIATDDISLIEKYNPNINVRCIEVNEENFKITTKLDYLLALRVLEDL